MTLFARLATIGVTILFALAVLGPGTRAWSQQLPSQPTVEAWVRAGAQYGRMRPFEGRINTLAFWIPPRQPPVMISQNVAELGFSYGFTRLGALPAFWFDKPLDNLADLPPIGVPFGVGFTEVSETALQGLAKQGQLKYLIIRADALPDAHLRHLAGLQLRSLMLPTKSRTEVALRHYLAAREPGKELDLRGWQVTDTALKDIVRLGDIEVLSLADTKVSNAGLGALSELKRLRSLDLAGSQMTDGGFQALAGARQLQALSLFSSGVGTDGLRDLGRLTELRWLNLARSKVSDSGLAEIERLSKLQYLWLTGTAVTDTGIARLAGLKQLESLDVRGTKVTDTAVAGLNLQGLRQPVSAVPQPQRPAATDQPAGLGTGATRCEGDACGSISVEYEARCAVLVSKDERPIGMEYLIHGSTIHWTIMPGGRDKPSSPYGCLDTGVGLYRASYATAVPRLVEKEAAKPACTWKVSADGIQRGKAELRRPPGSSAATITIGESTITGEVKLSMTYVSGWKELGGNFEVRARVTHRPLFFEAEAQVALDGKSIASFSATSPGENRGEIKRVFGPELQLLRAAKSIEVTLHAMDRDLPILSCRLPDMEEVFKDLTDTATRSTKTRMPRQKRNR